MSGFTASRIVKEIARKGGSDHAGKRQIAEEVAIALSYGGSTEAVMMATPVDLEDFAIGFSLNEGIVRSAGDILSIDVVAVDGGIDLQITLKDDRSQALKRRRRAKAGPVGCGLCGVESIEEALRPAADVSAVSLVLSPADISAAVDQLSRSQPLNALTRAVHAAGFYIPHKGLVAVREDVGRHNALDKLLGHLATKDINGGDGAVVMTSRLSVELVQKTARSGSPVLLGVSAPTALAIDMAEKSGMTLIALVRGEEYEVFTGNHRITTNDSHENGQRKAG